MDTFDSDADAQLPDQDSAETYDSALIDTNGDGSTDAQFTDENHDGVVDTERYDTDGDGVANVEYIDSDYDGVADQALFDTDGDGTADIELTDSTVSSDESAPLFPEASGAGDPADSSDLDTGGASDTTLTASDIVEGALPGPEYTN